MSEDARFEDGGARVLNLGAMDVEDLAVVSALAQDAVFPVSEIVWQPRRRRLALLLNRLRWEDQATTAAAPERVQSVLVVENVLSVGSQGVDRSERETVLSLLSVTFEPGPDASGNVLFTLAGDGALRAKVEALEVTLKDVTRPYAAPSGKIPKHPD